MNPLPICPRAHYDRPKTFAQTAQHFAAAVREMIPTMSDEELSRPIPKAVAAMSGLVDAIDEEIAKRKARRVIVAWISQDCRKIYVQQAHENYTAEFHLAYPYDTRSIENAVREHVDFAVERVGVVDHKHIFRPAD